MAQYLIGFAAVDITPPLALKVKLGGYIRWFRHASGVLDPLMARVMCIRGASDPRDSLITMSVDLVGMQQKHCRLAREVISRRTGVPVGHITIHLTHTHSSPDTIGVFPRTIITDALRLDVQKEVIAHILKGLVRAGVEAFADATRPFMIGFGESAPLETPPAWLRVAPYTPINAPIRYLKITDEGGELLAVLINHNGHPTQMVGWNTKFSGEYPAMVARALHEKYPGLKFGAFFNGASGNVSARKYGGYFAAIRAGKAQDEAIDAVYQTIVEHGRILVNYAAATINETPVAPLTTLRVAAPPFYSVLGRTRPLHERLQHYKTFRGRAKVWSKELGMKLKIRLWRGLHRLVNRTEFPFLTIRTVGHVILHRTDFFVAQLNDFYWLWVPGEPFYLYQEQFFAQVPTKKAFFVQMTNDTCGYIFPFAFHVRGGYEETFSFDMLFGEKLFGKIRRVFTDFLARQ
jgi:hypothetical protein